MQVSVALFPKSDHFRCQSDSDSAALFFLGASESFVLHHDRTYCLAKGRGTVGLVLQQLEMNRQFPSRLDFSKLVQHASECLDIVGLVSSIEEDL